MTQRNAHYDVIIVGGGPAGLSAALMLGRCRRNVIVFDDGQQRNLSSHAMHGFLTRDGTPPTQVLEIACAQLQPYGVEVRCVRVTDVCRDDRGFIVTTSDGNIQRARKVLLATGVKDEVPGIEGITELYGKSVHHCPYCDGWEVRDQPLAAWGQGEKGVALAFELLTWSRDVVLCTDGDHGIRDELVSRLKRHGVRVDARRITRLEGKDGILERIVFHDGEALPRRALFFISGLKQHTNLLERMGVVMNARGTAATGRYEQTDIPGLYVAGDASKDVQFVVVAAAEGAKAGFSINTELAEEDLCAAEEKANAAR